MSNRFITIENCTDLLNQVEHLGDVNSKASAWDVVFRYCVQEGMECNYNYNGIQRVIHFIGELKKLSSDKNVERSVATGDDSSTDDDKIKKDNYEYERGNE